MSKTNSYLTLFAMVGWGLFTWKLKNPTVKLETVEAVKYVDRVVNTETVKTVTKPSGSTIVTHTVTKDATVSKESSSATSVQAPIPQHSVGAGVGVDPLNPTPIYSFELGARLGDSPLWTALEANSSREVFVKLRYEF